MSKRLVINKGDRFGKLTIIEELEMGVKHSGQTFRKFKCLCDCGKEISVRLGDLKSGHTKSCGCSRVITLKNRKIHGLSNTRFYIIFQNIIQRCNNKNSISYKYYGGRGIKNEWLKFENFKNDMYESYLKHCKEFGKKQTTIDRIDVNGNYFKENCRWATILEQANNKTDTIYIEGLNMVEYCKKNNINYSTLTSRMHRKTEDMLSNKNFNKKPIKQLNENGKLLNIFFSITEASIKLGIKRRTINNCLKGWSKTAGGYKWVYIK